MPKYPCFFLETTFVNESLRTGSTAHPVLPLIAHMTLPSAAALY